MLTHIWRTIPTWQGKRPEGTPGKCQARIGSCPATRSIGTSFPAPLRHNSGFGGAVTQGRWACRRNGVPLVYVTRSRNFEWYRSGCCESYRNSRTESTQGWTGQTCSCKSPYLTNSPLRDATWQYSLPVFDRWKMCSVNGLWVRTMLWLLSAMLSGSLVLDFKHPTDPSLHSCS